mmetsp:Transcript_71427/g.206809  ORF Transcript_71427/g.206809 Transcript_71427/m.206809 type:complete len:88 (-) Transcript_71427:362-625(-)
MHAFSHLRPHTICSDEDVGVSFCTIFESCADASPIAEIFVSLDSRLDTNSPFRDTMFDKNLLDHRTIHNHSCWQSFFQSRANGIKTD